MPVVQEVQMEEEEMFVEKEVRNADSSEDDDESSESDYGMGKDVAGEEVDDDANLHQKIKELKRKREFEGDSEPEDLFCESEEEEEFVPPEPLHKLPVRRGPTSRSHCSSQSALEADYIPSSDEDIDQPHPDDSDVEVEVYLPSSGRKSRAKKRKARQWYEESRLTPQEQICWHLCFLDVYQFRRALVNLHVTQRRNFHYHRNNKDRIIVDCVEQECPFHMVASVIGNEKTFCIRKLQLEHTCAPSGENCKVPTRFVAKAIEDSMRTDPRAGVETVIEKTKEKFGVEVGKNKAYRARQKALSVVQGDQEAQYTRIRDYLQTVLDTNPGSRCIVTTRVVREHPSPNPRFHRLFMCLGAQIEGFLKGCRPFIGMFLSHLFHFIYSLSLHF